MRSLHYSRKPALTLDPRVLARLLLKISEGTGLGLYVFKLKPQTFKVDRESLHEKRITADCLDDIEECVGQQSRPSRSNTKAGLPRTKGASRKFLMENNSEELRKTMQEKAGTSNRPFNIYAASRNSQQIVDYTIQPVIAVSKANLRCRKQVAKRTSIQPLESESGKKTPFGRIRHSTKQEGRRPRATVKPKRSSNFIQVVDNWTAQHTLRQPDQPDGDLGICQYMKLRPVRQTRKSLIANWTTSNDESLSGGLSPPES